MFTGGSGAIAQSENVRATEAARRRVFAPRVLAEEPKYQLPGRCRKRTERDLEPSSARHDTPNPDERRRLLWRIIDLVRQAPWTVRSHGHLIATADSRNWVRERPDNRVRHDAIVERVRRVEVERLIRAPQVAPKEFIEGGIVR
jgi:hypothetical protein